MIEMPVHGMISEKCVERYFKLAEKCVNNGLKMREKCDTIYVLFCNGR